MLESGALRLYIYLHLGCVFIGMCVLTVGVGVSCVCAVCSLCWLCVYM